MESIKNILIRRDGLTKQEAEALLEEAHQDFWNRIQNNESPFDFCEEYFGLEPDYLDEFLAWTGRRSEPCYSIIKQRLAITVNSKLKEHS